MSAFFSDLIYIFFEFIPASAHEGGTTGATFIRKYLSSENIFSEIFEAEIPLMLAAAKTSLTILMKYQRQKHSSENI